MNGTASAHPASAAPLPGLAEVPIGHERLRAELRAGPPAHAALFVGPAGVGKRTLMAWLARRLACDQGADGLACGACAACRLGLRHPNLFWLEADGGPIGLEVVAAMQRAVALHPYAPGRKVVLLPRLEQLSTVATERLLKTVEEPPPDTVLLLGAVDRRTARPTLRSRCTLLPLRRVPEPTIAAALRARGAAEATATRLAGLADGCPGWAVRALGDPGVLERRAAALDRAAALVGAPALARLEAAHWLVGLDAAAAAETLQVWEQLWRSVARAGVGLPPVPAVRDQAALVTALAARLPSDAAGRALAALARARADARQHVAPAGAADGLCLALP